MYILTAEHSFDSAHFLHGYEGKCSNIHGHRWRVVVEVQSDTLHDSGQLEGMVVDFGDLKNHVKAMADAFDHTLIIQKDTMREATLNMLIEEGFSIKILPFRPTAENLAAFFFSEIEKKGYDVKRTTVYETPTNKATYEKR